MTLLLLTLLFQPAETAHILEQYVHSLLSDTAQVQTESSKYASQLKPDGSWPDIDYQSRQRAEWRAATHLDRTLAMAKAARLGQDWKLEQQTLHALEFWLDHDYRNPNWWWNEIGVPQLMGEIASLLLPELPENDLSRVIAIMKRSDWRRVPWTGANLIWGTRIEIVRGCLRNDPQVVAEGHRRMYEEIKIVSPSEEGIQADASFHQHGPQLYNGGYGLVFASDVGKFISFAQGTRFQIPPDRNAIFRFYLQDGERWMAYHGLFDYNAIGREITRPGTVTESLPEITGNKQFWCSDFMVHRRKGFYTSVKMFSTRTLNAELVNGEGKKSEHLSDGVNFLYRTGDEYRGIFPVWDWTKLPGATAIQGTLETGDPHPIGMRGKSAFVGGASDGTYGLAAMDLLRGSLTAYKAWFFFDDHYLALGAGITLSNDRQHDVATDVNQTLLVGNVVRNPHGRIKWVDHDQVGYVFGPHTSVSFSAKIQSGRWSDIGAGSTELVSHPVFNLWIDHGRSPRGGTYQYTILPGASANQTAAFAKHPPSRVLANREDVQAVYTRNLQLIEAVFRKPGSLATPIGRISTNHACLLLVRKTAGGSRVTASNPENQPLTLRVSLADKQITLQLPGGNEAGSSITARFEPSTP